MTNTSLNLRLTVGKLKAKADICIFVGYAPTKKAYRAYNKRTRKIQETIHVTFDELSREVVLKVDDVSFVDGVFDGAFGKDGDEGFIIGEGVVVSSSSLVKSTKSYLGRMMVRLIFLEGLEEEA
nr:retrovirus-related Pol polyprotein from transposon TNT 1-94 [Tanacetum cinerariifolium]